MELKGTLTSKEVKELPKGFHRSRKIRVKIRFSQREKFRFYVNHMLKNRPYPSKVKESL